MGGLGSHPAGPGSQPHHGWRRLLVSQASRGLRLVVCVMGVYLPDSEGRCPVCVWKPWGEPSRGGGHDSPMMEMGFRAKRSRPQMPTYLLRQPADQRRTTYSVPKNTTRTISCGDRAHELTLQLRLGGRRHTRSLC